MSIVRLATEPVVASQDTQRTPRDYGSVHALARFIIISFRDLTTIYHSILAAAATTPAELNVGHGCVVTDPIQSSSDVHNLGLHPVQSIHIWHQIGRVNYVTLAIAVELE